MLSIEASPTVPAVAEARQEAAVGAGREAERATEASPEGGTPLLRAVLRFLTALLAGHSQAVSPTAVLLLIVQKGMGVKKHRTGGKPPRCLSRGVDLVAIIELLLGFVHLVSQPRILRRKPPPPRCASPP